MTEIDLKALLDAVTHLACEAGREIMAVYGTDFSVDVKDDRSPLTEADLRSHHLIAAGLSRLTPELPQLSEESRSVDPAERLAWSTYWLIDPLDGTREFIKRNGEFTVNIALIRDHRPILGVVHVPTSGVSYSAAAGVGAFRRSRGGAAEPIRTRPAPSTGLRVMGSRSHGEGLSEWLQGLGDYELVSVGSSLKFCVVAEGEADFYPRMGPTSEWDTAAAHCVLEQAGGEVTDLEGNPLRYNTRADLLNPYFLAFGDRSRNWVACISPPASVPA